MQSSFGVNYMWAAYIAVWVIHGAYLLYLGSEYRKLQRDINEASRG